MRKPLIFLLSAFTASAICLLITTFILHEELKESLGTSISAGIGCGLAMMVVDLSKKKQKVA